MNTNVLVIGAGPAGLTAAYLLAKENIAVTVLEADPAYVGGLAKTITYKNFCFDIGGHRFFSKSASIEQLWNEILPDDMLVRPRSSRIFYRGKFFAYPLNPFDTIRKLGLLESTRCLFSYAYARIFPVKHPVSFTEWVTNHFGKRLFSIFFKTYTEKVWGMRCEDISADWAAQRINGLSLFAALINAMLPARHKQQTAKTLINHFRYPRKGPGMLWEACADKIKQLQGKIKLGCTVVKLTHDNTTWQVTYRDERGQLQQMLAKHVISSAPLRDVVLNYLPERLSPSALAAANRLGYRDFLMVVLIVRDTGVFKDQWLYVHDHDVDVARIQNFKSWSAEMVPDATMNCYGMEYFCFDHHALWATADDELITKASLELIKLGLAQSHDIVDGYVLRQSKAYPIYDHHYQSAVQTIRTELSDKYPSLHLVGRNGMHKYNNQDHSMMTAMLTVKNILAGHQQFDVWQINQDAEYLERNIPSPLAGEG